MLLYELMEQKESVLISRDLAEQVIRVIWMLADAWERGTPEREKLEDLLERLISQTQVKSVFPVLLWKQAWNLIPESRPKKDFPDDLRLPGDLKGLLQRMDFMDDLVDSFERRKGAFDSSIAELAKDHLHRAREEFGRGDYDFSNEFLMNAERICTE
jgi:hypothetical protein